MCAQELIDKIASLNAAIDDVSARLEVGKTVEASKVAL